MGLNRVTLPPDLACRSWRYGESVVAGYAAGHNANSRAVTCFDAHSNIELQAYARMAECAFCVWADISTEKLNWSGTCDDGADISAPDRIDIKHTKGGRRLIWPLGKNSIFSSKRFNRLVLVIGDIFNGFEISGWITKEDFGIKHHVAPVNHVLVHGTWFLDKSELEPMETFFHARMAT
jgi:hypothetical protein